MENYSITKTFNDYPAAHRQPKHKGHCALIHGHNWSFEITFKCCELTFEGFVVDFGKLKWVGEYLKDCFDHTLILSSDDPVLPLLMKGLGDTKLAKIVTVPNSSAESLAKFLYSKLNEMIPEEDKKRSLRVTKVTVIEEPKDRATYVMPEVCVPSVWLDDSEEAAEKLGGTLQSDGTYLFTFSNDESKDTVHTS